ncbi:Crp/Fnr family transcriptional regulator [Candidatus Bipolaricaulota bacterium]|nr:Crp/Fnr family transcriptional regulator [Candidatus Bipolaricaulota bacterium]
MPKISLKDTPAGCLAKAFPSLSDEERRALESLGLVLEFDADELIAQESSYCSGVYIVCQGLVAIGKYAPRTHEKRVLRFLAPGEWYGLEPFFLGGKPVNLQFARTIIESTLLFFETSRFRAFLEHHPQALFDLCRWFGREVAMLEFKLTREATESVDRNLALLLLALANKYGTPNADGTVRLEFPITRQTMAELLGVSLETLMRMLRRFRERELIETHRWGFEILSRGRLEEIARAPELYRTIIEQTL